MFPLLWYWMPQLHLPFSGDVSQDIAPVTDLFGSIKPEAGNGELEKAIFEIASYGRQLGLITEVLLGEAAPGAVEAAKVQASLSDLLTLHAEIEQLKAGQRRQLADTAVAALEKLRDHDAAALQQVLRRFDPSAG